MYEGTVGEEDERKKRWKKFSHILSLVGCRNPPPIIRSVPASFWWLVGSKDSEAFVQQSMLQNTYL